MTSAGAVRSWGERLRPAAVRLAIAGGLAAAAWLAGAVAANADESPARVDVLSPSTDSEFQEPAKTDAVARAGGLGARITERLNAKLGRPSTALTTLVAEDDGLDAKGGSLATTGSAEVQPIPEDEGAAPASIRTIRTPKSAEGTASAFRQPKPVPPPAELPAPPPVVEPEVAPPPAEPAPTVAARTVTTVRQAIGKVVPQPSTDRAEHQDFPDLPTGPDHRQPTPHAPSSASLGGTASDNGGARGATALITAPLPQLPKPSLVTVERPRTAGSPHNTPGLPPTSPD
ncbi:MULTISPECIES: hypothetical protein [unclassified Crossiella]|uniref:hypothetical protein n=1 Tax=unclassified Crossiella TaxID=2620835 RepID=UPI001FFE60E4|nr:MULTISPECIES: hypothetical protein [unclassified Crossiella]MCK2236656.1 hypothetical protein [Crossiella sp. S99.2]MCK2250324.1 hypothetical protein [Crossiella sp. S99.1]